MRKIFICLALTLVAMSASLCPAPAGQRVALVVGNGAYQHAPQIQNPRNDAEAVAAALRRLGFEVRLRIDLDKRGFREELRDFGEWSANAEVALFFYAGQGIEAEGRNWLGPVDMNVTGSADVPQEMQSLDDALAALQRSSGVKIAIIDACRDNPFGSTRAVGGRRQGLVRIEPVGGLAIIMSTSPGQVALDGTGLNSPFATALLAHLETRDLEISLLMRHVVADVVRLTDGKQQPWFYATLREDFFFNRSAGTLPTATPAVLQAAAVQTDRIAEEVWKFIGATKDPEQLKSFVINYPASRHVREANERMTALVAAQQRLKAAAAAGPEKRVALVIGNGDYQHSRSLKNPTNDAKEVAEALKRLGFQVRIEVNLDKRGFDEVLPDFAATSAGADIALVYFAGHAIEFQGAAYIMPIDARPISRSHIRNQLKSVRDIVFDLEHVSGLKLVVVDGCRDNPLGARLFGMLGVPRSAAGDVRGMSIPNAERQQLGELIVAFATLHGEVAYDGGAEPNSPFTTAFLRHIEDDKIDVDQLFRIVKDEVMAATKGVQNPAIESYRGKRPFALRPAPAQPAMATK